MARGMPSLAALLGLVAVAGYQNREKISEFVKGLANDPNSAAGGIIDSVRKGGLGELVDHFTKNGEGKTAEVLGGQRPQCADHRYTNGKNPRPRPHRQSGKANRTEPRRASLAPVKNPARSG